MLCVLEQSLKGCVVLIAAMLLALGPAVAGEADVVDVKISKQGGTFNFDVTVKHADTGWKHYANKWEVVAPDGTVLGKRVLFHPHVEEQPFTPLAVQRAHSGRCEAGSWYVPATASTNSAAKR